MKKVIAVILSFVMVFSLAACGSTFDSTSSKKPSGKDYESLVIDAFWEGACGAFGINYSDFNMLDTSTSYISDSTTSDGYTAHYYLIKTSFDTENAFGKKITHQVTARCYYVPDFSKSIYITYITLDGEKVLFDEEKEDWLLGIGGASSIPNTNTSTSSNKENNNASTSTENIKHIHSYGEWENYDDAQHKRTCKACYETETEKHSWNLGEITKEPSCSQYGEKTFTCSVCKSEKQERIAKTEHEFSQKVESYKHLKTRKTYTNGSVYYYSCSCGETGTNTFVLNDRIEWLTNDMLQKDFNLSSGWHGESELRLWTYMTGIGEQGNSYLIYDQMRNGMGTTVYNGSYNGVTIRFYCDPKIYSGPQYVFNYDDLVAAGIL